MVILGNTFPSEINKSFQGEWRVVDVHAQLDGLFTETQDFLENQSFQLTMKPRAAKLLYNLVIVINLG